MRGPHHGSRGETKQTAASPIPVPPNAGPDQLAQARRAANLEEKYRQLCAKYDALVRKYDMTAGADVGAVRLGWWLLRSSESGLALVRDDAIELCNPRWKNFDRRSENSESWEAIEAGEGNSQFTSLLDVAQHEARELLCSGDRAASRTCRYKRTGSQQILEIRSERAESQSDAVLSLAHDVSQQVQSAAELRLARDALHHRDRLQVIGQMASGVAHDLNNALNVMRLRLELLRRESGEPTVSHLSALEQIVNAAAARVARMHDLSRKQIDVKMELLDVRKVIQEAIALAETQFEHHSVAEGRHFRIACDVCELPPVRASIAELEHLFVNLLLNARDAMPRGGTISIKAKRDGDYALITVADEGTGIPEQNLERIFDSFFTTKGRHGTGLGLAMARGTMARLGGTIRARNLGSGAEFILRFPFLLEASQPKEIPVRLQSVQRHGELRILIVDDDVDCLDVTQAVLEAEGLTVDTARSGAEALELLKLRAYDLLLCDVGMPEMSGWQVAQEARQLRSSMRIYMVTGWAGEFASGESHRQDANGVLAKPLQLDELRSVISQIIPQTRMEHGQG